MLAGSRSLGIAAVIYVLGIASIPDIALAWGASGYRLVGELASQSLPSGIPEFLRAPEAGRQIAEVARQPDWSRAAGDPHDADSDPANYVLVGDDLKISGGPLLSALPANREAYDAALRGAGSGQYRAGYLPYAIIDGWQQLAMDLAYWRADAAGAHWAKTPDELSWFLKDQYVREGLTIRDLGYLAHLVANGGQPMNVSVHANGWGNYPNPQKFSNAKDLRARFEATVVRSRIGEKDISAAMAPYRDCRCSIQRRVSDYLLATQKQVVNLYRIEKSGRRYIGRQELRCGAFGGGDIGVAGPHSGRLARERRLCGGFSGHCGPGHRGGKNQCICVHARQRLSPNPTARRKMPDSLACWRTEWRIRG